MYQWTCNGPPMDHPWEIYVEILHGFGLPCLLAGMEQKAGLACTASSQSSPAAPGWLGSAIGKLSRLPATCELNMVPGSGWLAGTCPSLAASFVASLMGGLAGALHGWPCSCLQPESTSPTSEVACCTCQIAQRVMQTLEGRSPWLSCWWLDALSI